MGKVFFRSAPSLRAAFPGHGAGCGRACPPSPVRLVRAAASPPRKAPRPDRMGASARRGGGPLPWDVRPRRSPGPARRSPFPGAGRKPGAPRTPEPCPSAPFHPFRMTAPILIYKEGPGQGFPTRRFPLRALCRARTTRRGPDAAARPSLCGPARASGLRTQSAYPARRMPPLPRPASLPGVGRGIARHPAPAPSVRRTILSPAPGRAASRPLRLVHHNTLKSYSFYTFAATGRRG